LKIKHLFFGIIIYCQTNHGDEKKVIVEAPKIRKPMDSVEVVVGASLQYKLIIFEDFDGHNYWLKVNNTDSLRVGPLFGRTGSARESYSKT
jgi:hypothetical protein